MFSVSHLESVTQCKKSYAIDVCVSMHPVHFISKFNRWSYCELHLAHWHSSPNSQWSVHLILKFRSISYIFVLDTFATLSFQWISICSIDNFDEYFSHRLSHKAAKFLDKNYFQIINNNRKDNRFQWTIYAIFSTDNLIAVSEQVNGLKSTGW